MKLYIATSFLNILEARAVMMSLRQAGHTITHDWTRESVDPTWPADRQDAYLQRCGSEDYAGVLAADAVVLVNHAASRDAMVEFGVALGQRLPVYVLYPERRGSVFFHRAHLCADLPDLIVRLGAR